LLACVGAALILAFLISAYRANDRRLHAICKVWSTEGFGGFNSTYDGFNLTSYRDQLDRPVAYTLFVYDANDPNVPTTTRQYRFKGWQGGVLKVDGNQVDPMSGPKLFVNGAYGYTAQLDLTESDVAALEAIVSNSKRYDGLLQFWREKVQPKLFKIQGTAIAGQRDGLWTFRLQDGSLYLEANYQMGDRHGEWTSYYPGGGVQCRRHFDGGRPAGKWDYYDDQGRLLGSLEWERGFLKTKGREVQSGGSGGSARFVTHPSGKRTGSVFSEADGGTFWIGGQAMKRPERTAGVLGQVSDLP